jgi:phospholipid/cholesterol/gamma-HCH transport system substrate-binding protein
MKRALAIAIAILALAALAAFGPFGGGGSSYTVRAYFDNGDFVVPGEDVRVAGAKVGSVVSTAVSLPGEAVHADGRPDPGKAAIVMQIDDSGFQDFRRDASCVIRPQSLLGEKYIDCTPTRPRAPESPVPAPLKVIPKGQPGTGERFLPLENNGHIVDIDLVQNIQRLPYAERFRLILNELGAGVAGQGDNLNTVIRRADPALRYTDEVLHILAGQNHVLADLARDSETALHPLARERRHLSGFIDNAGVAAQATAERSADLEAGFQKFPHFLDELRSTSVQLRRFSGQAQPVFSELGGAAPSLTTLTKRTAPFARAGEKSLISLGDAAAKSTKPLVQSDSLVIDLRDLARAAQSPSKNLAKLLGSLQKTNGFKQLLEFLYNTSGSANAFDKFGHILRANLLETSCVDYATVPFGGCGANFSGGGVAKTASPLAAPAAATPPVAASGAVDATGAASAAPTTAAPARAVDHTPVRGAANILHFLLGDGAEGGRP